MPKRSVRRTMLTHRRSLADAEFRSASLLIQDSLLGTEEYRRARTIVLYAPIHNEVDTARVTDLALKAGKRVAYPVVVGHGLVFREVRQLSSLQEGTYGIMEPCPDCAVFNPDDVDLFVLPGVAFDLQGHRIGYGKGYYDKTLHRLEGKGRLAAFCYDFQLVENIAGEPHDVKIDLIITEKRVVRP